MEDLSRLVIQPLWSSKRKIDTRRVTSEPPLQNLSTHLLCGEADIILRESRARHNFSGAVSFVFA